MTRTVNELSEQKVASSGKPVDVPWTAVGVEFGNFIAKAAQTKVKIDDAEDDRALNGGDDETQHDHHLVADRHEQQEGRGNVRDGAKDPERAVQGLSKPLSLNATAMESVR